MAPWHHTLLVRFTVGVLLGVGAAVAAGLSLGIAAGLLAGWGTMALVITVWILIVVWPMNPEQTRTHATREDPGRRIARVVALVGSVVSLAAVAIVLVQSHNESKERAYVFAAIAVGSVIASWALIQTDYMLRYARMYYAEPVGGISFNDDEPPQYTDFVYLSVGLGMTYQVADTNVSTKELRKVVIAQTMLAYLFGAVILATVINLVSGLG